MGDILNTVRTAVKAGKSAIEISDYSPDVLEKLKGILLDALVFVGKAKAAADASEPADVKWFNHAFTFAFEVVSEASCESDDDYPSADEVRQALLASLASKDDTELMENVGAPFDSFEVE